MHFSHVAARGDLVHHVQQRVLEDGAQAAGAGLVADRLVGAGLQRVLGEDQLDAVQGEEALELAQDRVLRLRQDADQHVLAQRLQPDDHRQAADELRDQAVGQQVVVRDVLHQLVDALLALLAVEVRLEAHGAAVAAQPLLDDPVDALEGAAADEEDVLGVDLDELLVRVLASALRRHVGNRTLDDLEQRLLHALAGDVARDRRVVALARDLVDLVDVDDAALGPADVEVGGLDQVQEDVLDVLTDVAGLGQRRGVGDREGYVEDLRQRARQVGLADAGGPDEEDVALLELDVAGGAAGWR